MSAAAGDEDVPPLEDMSHAFKSPPPLSAPSQQQPQTQKNAPHEPTASADAASAAAPAKQQQQQSAVTQSASGFGGMKRGFLTSPKSTATSTSTSTKQQQQQHQPDLPYIRSDPAAAQSSLQLDEVQQSMRQQSAEGLFGGDGDKSWLTEDLLAKVESDPFLTGCLANPRMSAALAKFQADPKRAIAEYQDDEEVQRFLKAFSGILGSHFASIADKQQQQTTAAPAAAPPPVDPEVAEVLARPGVREALTSADVQRWMALMRADPAAAQAQLRDSRDGDFQRRVRLLFENGLLGFAK